MSFALDVKKELVNNKKSKEECYAFLFGMLLTCKIEENKIYFTTTTLEIGKYFIFLIEELFGEVDYSIEKENSNIMKVINFHIKDEDFKISNYYDLSNIHSNYKENIFNNKNLVNLCISGYFVVKGSVNDPNKPVYHLEILCNNYNSATYLQKMINLFELNSKIAKRREKLIVYLKDAEKIVDLIRVMGATKISFLYEDIRISRDLNNSINRVMNCELANEQKAMKAANEQLKYIQYLEYNYPLERLDPKILLVMKVRKEHPEDTLVELLEKIKIKYDITLSKPGLSHRFAKIKQLALEHQEGMKK